jgi:GAF domain-containing protein
LRSPLDYASAMAEAARTISRERTLEQTLNAIASTARTSVPGFDHVGISVVDHKGRMETRAATDPLVFELDRLEYELGEGPGLSAMRETPVVVVPHARQDQRWPGYLPKALALGLRAQLAVRLFLEDAGTLGALNLYSTSRDVIHPDAEGIADLFAAHAAIALQRAREVSHLSAGLESRKIIGQAMGILMERYQLDEDRAFAFLVRASSHSNIKVRDLAAELVDEANERPSKEH